MIEKLIKIFQSETGIKDIQVTKDTILRNELKINSYDFIQVICAIEDEFDIEISDKELVKMKTVGDVINYIELNS